MSKLSGSPLARRPGKLDKTDYHHIFFQGKHYTQGYAKLLREHPYCGDYISQNGLHRIIHSRVHDVPTPPGKVCKAIYFKLNEALQNGVITQEDSLEDRLKILIAITEWAPTRAMLEYQLAITEFGR